MSRKSSRENVFKLIYEYAVTGEKNELTVNLMTKDMGADDLEYFTEVFNGVIEKYDILSDIISKNTNDFTLSRLFKVDFSILLLAAYEIIYFPSVPVKVAANEAVELAKTYSTEKSAAYINGVLATIIKENGRGATNECKNN